MPYTDQQEYAKHLAAKLSSSGCSDCEECNEGCDDCESENCGCCPPGLVEVKDAEGNSLGCLTPNDAELYSKNLIKCPDGYIKVFSGADVFLGCLTPTEYAEYLASIPA